MMVLLILQISSVSKSSSSCYIFLFLFIEQGDAINRQLETQYDPTAL